jgi:hypothetical protein
MIFKKKHKHEYGLWKRTWATSLYGITVGSITQERVCKTCGHIQQKYINN